ncbi:hypothetical protein EI538_23825, partial [Salmonella enterica]
KTGFTHSDLLCWQIDYAGGSLNVNGTIMRDTYTNSSLSGASSIPLEGEINTAFCEGGFYSVTQNQHQKWHLYISYPYYLIQLWRQKYHFG